MAETIPCAQCGSPLRLPEAFIGREVCCPACQQTFTARLPAEPPPVGRPLPEDERREARPSRYPDTRDDDDADRRARRRRAFEEARSARERVQSHRGGTVLGLGIASVCLCCIPALSLALGIGAIVMGTIDLAKMRNGAMDPRGRGLTTAGLVCGILGPLLTVFFVGIIIVLAQTQ